MKTIALIAFMTLAGFGMLAHESRGVAREVPVVSTNEGGCWDKCKTCEEKCRKQSGDAKRACDESCWKTNDGCCNGVGGKGVYKMCGCTDK